MKTPANKPKSTLDAFSFVSGIGITFVVILGICVFGGVKLDDYLDTKPWGLVSGIIVGLITAFYSVYSKLKIMNK